MSVLIPAAHSPSSFGDLVRPMPSSCLPCCPTPSYSLLQQEIVSLKEERDALRRQVNQPLSNEAEIEYPPLFHEGVIGYHPCGSRDEESMSIKDKAVALYPDMTPEYFDDAAIAYNHCVYRRRIGPEKALEGLLYQIDEDFPLMPSGIQKEIAYSIMICAVRAIVCQPKAKDESLERKSFLYRFAHNTICSIISSEPINFVLNRH
jgi:hypothetical protein